MKTYCYGAVFEPGEDRGITVSFPDVPEAISQGDDMIDAMAQAEEVLGLALLSYLEADRPLPMATTKHPGLAPITPAPDVSAKLAVIEAFNASGLTQAQLAEKIGKDGREVRRILDPDHPSKLPALSAALRAMGKRLVVAVAEAA